MADSRNDREYLELLRRQDSKAFEELVRDHQQIVAGLAQASGLRSAELDDAAAESFASVWKALPRFEGRSSLGTWVYRIACRTIARRRTQLAGRNPAADPRDPEDAGKGPAERTEEAERDQIIWAAVARLEPRQAMAVELYYRRGWAVEQVAEVIGCPIATAKTLLFRRDRS